MNGFAEEAVVTEWRFGQLADGALDATFAIESETVKQLAVSWMEKSVEIVWYPRYLWKRPSINL